MKNEGNLDILFKNLDLLIENCKVNIYAVKNHLTRSNEIFSIALPSNIKDYLLPDIRDNLKPFSNAQCIGFDPVNTIDNTYERLPIERIGDKWENIRITIEHCKDFKSQENKELAKKLNLSVIELSFQNKLFYLCAKQQSCERLFKGKKAFLSSNDEVKIFSAEDLLIINPNIDFIIDNDVENPWIYILHKEKFESIFQYDEFLKENVKQNINIIEEWSFFKSVDVIKECIEQKNVYKNLSKVFDNEDYLLTIKNTDSKILKKRLIDKSSGSFSKDDFDGNLLVVTKSNLDKIMKMLSKGFKYNFFEDKAEE